LNTCVLIFGESVGTIVLPISSSFIFCTCDINLVFSIVLPYKRV